MMKKIFSLLRKVIVAVLLIYTYNKMAIPLDLFIPINILTILLVTFFGIPSIFMLILYSLIFI